MQAWCDLHVVTSRQHIIRDMTIEWLSMHYPGIFSSIHFGNHFAQEGTARKKSEICKCAPLSAFQRMLLREIDADVLIDDNPSYALDCASSGMDVILYNFQDAYPWSQLPERDNRIKKVTCWSDVPRMLKSLHSKQDQACSP